MKLSYITATLAALATLAACNKQNDVVNNLYKEYDSKPVTAHFDYTLTAADYSSISNAAVKNAGDDAALKAKAGAVAKTSSLNSAVKADTYVPAVLAANNQGLHQGSSIMVTYNFTEDVPEHLAGLTATPKGEEIAGEDFESIDPAANAPYTKWEQNGWRQFYTKGTGITYWDVRKRGDLKYASVTSYQSTEETETEAWVVSPAIAIPDKDGNNFTFDLCVGSWTHAGLTVHISDDVKAATEPATATWKNISSKFTIPTEPAKGFGPMTSAGIMSLGEYKGKTIYIAFRYNGSSKSTPAHTTTYQIDNIRVFNGIIPVAGKLYQKDGEVWKEYKDGIALTADDYKDMGITSLTAANAPKHLPAFLKKKVDYPHDGQVKAVLYTGGIDEYRYDAAADKWAPVAVPTVRSEQFIYADNGWMFDPTVNYTMVNADYQLIVSTVLADPDFSKYKNGTFTNEEWYYGTSAKFNNFNFRLSYRTGTDASKNNDTNLHKPGIKPEEQVAMLWKRLIEEGMPLYLKTKWPLAVGNMLGVEVVYKIKIKVYYPNGTTNGDIEPVLTYKVLTDGAEGAPATFGYVSGAPAEFYKPTAGR